MCLSFLPALLRSGSYDWRGERIKIKNCLLGLKNVKNALELNTFTNEQVIENHENAFVKNNVRNCCIIDRITSNITNFPTLSSNIVCSYGTLDSLYVVSNDASLGVVFPGVDSEDKTIAQLTNEIITEYDFLRNGDAITFFYYFCTNITSSENKLFEWDNPDLLNNTVESDFCIHSTILSFDNPYTGKPCCFALKRIA